MKSKGIFVVAAPESCVYPDFIRRCYCTFQYSITEGIETHTKRTHTHSFTMVSSGEYVRGQLVSLRTKFPDNELLVRPTIENEASNNPEETVKDSQPGNDNRRLITPTSISTLPTRVSCFLRVLRSINQITLGLTIIEYYGTAVGGELGIMI